MFFSPREIDIFVPHKYEKNLQVFVLPAKLRDKIFQNVAHDSSRRGGTSPLEYTCLLVYFLQTLTHAHATSTHQKQVVLASLKIKTALLKVRHNSCTSGLILENLCYSLFEEYVMVFGKFNRKSCEFLSFCITIQIFLPLFVLLAYWTY